jgi:HTH-type transcriptional regulator / antitoxin HigA
MTLTFDRESYANLLKEFLPRPIRVADEYQRILAIVESLIHKENASPEEEQLLDLCIILVEKFELEQYPSQNLSTPHSRLLHLMEANDLRQEDLLNVFGSSTIAGEVISGQRSINETQAQKLADRFNLPPKLFYA